MLKTKSEVFRTDDMTDISCGICTHNTHSRREDDQERHHRNQSHNFRQNEVGG